MKKLVSLLLCLALVLSMAACGNTNVNTSENPGTQNSQNPEVPETDVV